MAIRWHNIRIPVDLHRRIQMLAQQRDRSEAHNLIRPPDNFQDKGTPLHFIIERAITEFEGHRQRSSYAARKKRENPTILRFFIKTVTRQDRVKEKRNQGEHVYTVQPEGHCFAFPDTRVGSSSPDQIFCGNGDQAKK